MKTIEKMYEHVYWANQRILDTLQGAKDDIHAEWRLFSHLLMAEKVWLTRLQGLDSSQLSIWPEVDIKSCEELVQQNKEGYTAFLATLTNNDLDKILSYTNSTGMEFNNSVRDILTHVGLHGHYHRGQINLRLRADGVEPVHIDFISFVR